MINKLHSVGPPIQLTQTIVSEVSSLFAWSNIGAIYSDPWFVSGSPPSNQSPSGALNTACAGRNSSGRPIEYDDTDEFGRREGGLCDSKP